MFFHVCAASSTPLLGHAGGRALHSDCAELVTCPLCVPHTPWHPWLAFRWQERRVWSIKTACMAFGLDVDSLSVDKCEDKLQVIWDLESLPVCLLLCDQKLTCCSKK